MFPDRRVDQRPAPFAVPVTQDDPQHSRLATGQVLGMSFQDLVIFRHKRERASYPFLRHVISFVLTSYG